MTFGVGDALFAVALLRTAIPVVLAAPVGIQAGPHLVIGNLLVGTSEPLGAHRIEGAVGFLRLGAETSRGRGAGAARAADTRTAIGRIFAGLVPSLAVAVWAQGHHFKKRTRVGGLLQPLAARGCPGWEKAAIGGAGGRLCPEGRSRCQKDQKHKSHGRYFWHIGLIVAM